MITVSHHQLYFLMFLCHFFFIVVKFAQRPRINCVKSVFVDEYQTGYGKDCKCPVPCSEHIFTPSISYSALSDLKLQDLLMDPSLQDLKRKFNHALEIKERVISTNRSGQVRSGQIIVFFSINIKNNS